MSGAFLLKVRWRIFIRLFCDVRLTVVDDSLQCDYEKAVGGR